MHPKRKTGKRTSSSVSRTTTKKITFCGQYSQCSVRRNGRVLQDCPKAFQADKDINIVLATCQQDGRALKYASAELKADKEVILAACVRNMVGRSSLLYRPIER
jgi:hypothetical protein